MLSADDVTLSDAEVFEESNSVSALHPAKTEKAATKISATGGFSRNDRPLIYTGLAVELANVLSGSLRRCLILPRD